MRIGSAFGSQFAIGKYCWCSDLGRDAGSLGSRRIERTCLYAARGRVPHALLLHVRVGVAEVVERGQVLFGQFRLVGDELPSPEGGERMSFRDIESSGSIAALDDPLSADERHARSLLSFCVNSERMQCFFGRQPFPHQPFLDGQVHFGEELQEGLLCDPVIDNPLDHRSFTGNRRFGHEYSHSFVNKFGFADFRSEPQHSLRFLHDNYEKS